MGFIMTFLYVYLTVTYPLLSLLPIWLIPSSSQLHCIHVFDCPFFPSLCDPVSFIKVAYKA